MLFATQSTSVEGTQKYFETVLTQGDYYLGQEVSGHWRGKGADLLGLGEGAQVSKDQFVALLKGYHPITGKRLTQRIRKDRRPGMDLTYSVPKSVSLLWAAGGDERIIDILQEATHESMQLDVEPLMQRRVRSGRHFNSKHKANTGKLVYANFLHKTSRPVDGHPDPHLHIHAFVMNWTEEGGKYYAGEFEEIVRQRASLQARFEARLARKLQQIGYSVTHVQYMQSGKLKQGWEIQGVERSTIEKFSRRTAQIEQYADEHDIEDAHQKGQLAKRTREKKDQGDSVATLKSKWWDRLDAEEKAFFRQTTGESQQDDESTEMARADRSLQYALDHYLYRQSTVERHQLVATALEHGLTLHPESVERAIDSLDVIQRKILVNGCDRHYVTTRSVLDAERRMIAYARDGRGTRKAIRSAEYRITRDWLNEQQQSAVRHVLQSRDAVMAVIGGAGTGKTSLMQEAVDAIRMQRKEVYTFAPSTGAKEVLQKEGFANAQTVEYLIRNTRLHEQLKDQVLWIDESGLLDVRSMNEVFTIAEQQNARVVLSGDIRQHSSPRRGEAMRLLNDEAGLQMARIEKIQRQQGRYQEAVVMISRGHEVVDASSGKTGLLAGFDLLDKMGKIKELSAKDGQQQLAETYLGAIEKGKSSLIVAPTHAEAYAVTEEIRTQLQTQGKLATDERVFIQYRSLNLSEAEKREPRTYERQKDLIVQFHQNTKGGFKRGSRFRVISVMDGKIELKNLETKRHTQLPLGAADRFEVYVENELRIASGDKIRFSLGGTTKNGRGRISNGRLDEVKGFDRRGNLVLKNNWVVSKDYAHLDLGYVITSHASQGKDRDVAIAAMGSQSLAAINAKQFYVTVSRGREDVVLYVDDKEKVRQAIQRSGEQLSATEMVGAGIEVQPRTVADEHTRKQSFQDRVRTWWQSMQRELDGQQQLGRHRDAAADRSFGFNSVDPTLGRSPT